MWPKYLSKRLLLAACGVLTLAGYATFTSQQFHSFTTSLPPRGRHSGGRGYLLTLRYAGQQTMASCGLLSQQCWLSSFSLPVDIVEPFIWSSHLGHLESWWINSSVTDPPLRYRDLYNLNHFNLKSYRADSSVLKSWEDFLKNAPRDIIAVTLHHVHIENCIANARNTQVNCRGGAVDHDTIAKFTSGCVQGHDMTKATDYLSKEHGFRLAKEVCFNCENFPEEGFSPEMFTDLVLHDYDPGNVSIIFNTWKYSIMMTPDCKENSHCFQCRSFSPNTDDSMSSLLQPSWKLKKDARYYVSKMLKYPSTSELSVAVMIRLEWLLIHLKSKESFFKCFSRLEEKFKKVRAATSPESLPFVAMDIGEYGSDTMNKTYRHNDFIDSNEALNKTKSLLSRMYSNYWDYSDWERSFQVLAAKRTSARTGYVAAVQREIASHARCLIVMGGGHFQMLALEQYYRHHDPETRCVHRIVGCGYSQQ